MVMTACSAFQIWTLGLNKNIAHLAKALPASVKVFLFRLHLYPASHEY